MASNDSRPHRSQFWKAYTVRMARPDMRRRLKEAPDPPILVLPFLNAQREAQPLFIEPSRLCIRVDVYRHRAEYDLKQYLKHLAQYNERYGTVASAATPAADITTVTGNEQIRHRFRIDISRNHLIQNLNTLETVLAYAKNNLEPPKFRLPPSTSTFSIFFTVAACLIRGPLSRISIITAVSGLVYLTAPPAWRFYQHYRLDSARASVRALRTTCENDMGAIDERSLRILDESRFKFLERIFKRKY
ncbi:hypothetical protein BGZ61DRAFT_584398 [Ilyonectria robusta]|uniref:uncharacterized protein n=1 Tax=Ilyonectria robusta TaxID=1079257 RepID=UPI001E8E601E|nr:uncharacterized protein BGZ61DRAFT_584398 [Ilyonectria robusta]KAH8734386.1 hypothetical protein BGZ61DRAFT_584398 [Ilyonectria robusta]